MLPRSLRRGDKCPNPGAVHKGCSRPKALRFGSPLSGQSIFGDGAYTGNIMQGGIALQPQDYLLDGITPLPQCIVFTGAAVVAPDAFTGAAAFSCPNLVGIGASASLSAATNCKALLGFVRGRIALRSGASIHMNKLGKAGNFGDLSPDMLLPARLRPRIACGPLKTYVVKGRGAEGGTGGAGTEYSTDPGTPGVAAGPMQTGGGGGGNGGVNGGGNGGCGGPCCGGAAGGGGNKSNVGTPAGPYGGPAGDAAQASQGGSGGAAGDPLGALAAGTYASALAEGPGGGLLFLFTGGINIASGCVVSSDGARGGYGYVLPGSGAGGGCVVIVTRKGGYVNNGTVRAAGGAMGGYYQAHYASPGGAGSVNIFEI